MRTSLAVMDIVEEMAVKGNPNSVSDAGVAALCVRTAVMGANLNVRINASGIEDRTYAVSKLAEGAAIQEEAILRESEVLLKVNEIIKQL